MAPGKGNSEAVKVVVRCRPMSEREVTSQHHRVVDMDLEMGQVQVKNPKVAHGEPPKTFTFDRVFDWNSSQEDIYRTTAKTIVDSTLEGYNGTIFAYGQTGTGKSHTMEGKDSPAELRGVIPRSFNHIFEAIDAAQDTDFLVRASYLEIYNEEIRDLLGKNPNSKLELKEHVDTGVYVKDLTAFVVKGVSEITNVLTVGKKNRTVGSTLMNQDSSRSHSLFTITIEQSSRGAEGHIRVGKLNMVDLAGSERQSKTGATGARLKEATKINLSLSALSNVISSLVESKSSHIPYRDSKLTRLLQDSLGGNTKTLMVANLGPADYNYDETISTLRYANRAKNIKNKPKINEDPKDTMLREFQDEISRLKAQLGAAGAPKTIENVVEKEVSSETVEAMKRKFRDQMKASIRRSDSTNKSVQELKKKAEQEALASMKEMISAKTTSEKERAELQQAIQSASAEMDTYSAEMQKEKAEMAKLQAKLQAMEGKVLHGGVNLLDKQDELEAEARRKELELQRQREEEKENQKKISELQEMQLIAEEHYKSIEDEVEMKTKKLKKLFSNYKSSKSELSDIAKEFQQEREDLLETVRDLTQQIKLKDLVVAMSIPQEYQEKIMQHTHYDEVEDAWHIDHAQYCGGAVRARREAHIGLEGEAGPGGLDDESFDEALGGGHGIEKVSDNLQHVYFSYESLG